MGVRETDGRVTRRENAFLLETANAENAGFSGARYAVARKLSGKKSGIIHALADETLKMLSNDSCFSFCVSPAMYAT